MSLRLFRNGSTASVSSGSQWPGENTTKKRKKIIRPLESWQSLPKKIPPAQDKKIRWSSSSLWFPFFKNMRKRKDKAMHFINLTLRMRRCLFHRFSSWKPNARLCPRVMMFGGAELIYNSTNSSVYWKGMTRPCLVPTSASDVAVIIHFHMSQCGTRPGNLQIRRS